jgi:hypothetical protein
VNWTRDQKLVVISVVVAVALGVSAFFVPEVRYFLRLEKPPEATYAPISSPPSATLQTTPTPTQTTEPPIQEQATRLTKAPASQKTVTRAPATQSTEPPALNVTPSNSQPRHSTPKPVQKAKAKVNGNSNVAGNNVDGNNNVVGNGNRTAPTAIAPNGIAISGGNVSNPTVNNITALPDLTMSDTQEKQVTDSIAQTFTGVDVSITEVQPSQSMRDFSERLARILKASGANVELSSASYYVPPAAQTLHRGMSIVSFPAERKNLVDKFVNALGTARAIQFVPIYERTDKKVCIVVNRSMDTPEEGKQY